MITILDDNFSQLNDFLANNKPSKLFILVDENTHGFCLPTLLGNIETEIPFEILEIEAGEDMKNIQTANQLWEILTEMQADRKSLIINLGGGVITDLGGFIASTYKRGISFINIPTTLLGMCDASIGGKTGIDLMSYKNIVGTFAHPESIFIYDKFLNTLPYEQLRSGFAEMLKHGLIADASHWEDLINIDSLTPQSVSPFIKRSMEIKQSIVEIDFKEKNIRKNLNFGHTIGHAIESLFLDAGTPILHGEAVALGMVCETELSYLEGLISVDSKIHIINNILRFYPTINITHLNYEDLFRIILNDKKNTNNNINFSLVKGIGEGIFDYQAVINNVQKSLNFYQKI